MASTIIPSQIGYTAPGSAKRSQIYMGKNVAVGFEAIGLGLNGRPDVLEAFKIHISKIDKEGVASPAGAFYFDITDVLEIQAKTNFPKVKGVAEELFFKPREVSICEIDKDGNGVEKNMVIFGSQTYPVSGSA